MGQAKLHPWAKPYEPKMAKTLQSLTTSKKYVMDMLSGCAVHLCSCIAFE